MAAAGRFRAPRPVAAAFHDLLNRAGLRFPESPMGDLSASSAHEVKLAQPAAGLARDPPRARLKLSGDGADVLASAGAGVRRESRWSAVGISGQWRWSASHVLSLDMARRRRPPLRTSRIASYTDPGEDAVATLTQDMARMTATLTADFHLIPSHWSGSQADTTQSRSVRRGNGLRAGFGGRPVSSRK